MLALGPGHQLHDVVLSLCAELGANLRLDFERPPDPFGSGDSWRFSFVVV